MKKKETLTTMNVRKPPVHRVRINAPVQPAKKRIRAIRDFVVIHPEEPLRYKGGIIIPESADDEKNPPSGIVVSVGCGLVEGGQIIPLKVKVGDHVFLPRNAGTLIRDHPVLEDCFVCRENVLFGVADDIRPGEAPAFKTDNLPGMTRVESPWQ